MGIARLMRRFEAALEGAPNSVLTLLLVVAAVVLVWVALRATAIEKAVVAAWVFFP